MCGTCTQVLDLDENTIDANWRRRYRCQLEEAAINRVSGTYPKHPLIRLWTSDRDWNLIEKTHDEIDVVYLVLSHHPNLAP